VKLTFHSSNHEISQSNSFTLFSALGGDMDTLPNGNRPV